MSMVDLGIENIAKIVSFTSSPKDACRLALVCSGFRAAADSDVVWERFLPPDYQEIICKFFLLTSSSLKLLSKKVIYFNLCDHPIVFHNDTMIFVMDKQTGRKCYMFGARRLSIVSWDEPDYWLWVSLPESRFQEVAQLKTIRWLEFAGRFEPSLLSPKTTYIAYLIFKLAEYNGYSGHVEFSVSVPRQGYHKNYRGKLNESQDRGDGWMEIKMGEFHIQHQGYDGEVVCTARETNDSLPKSGLFLNGIEFRPLF